MRRKAASAVCVLALGLSAGVAAAQAPAPSSAAPALASVRRAFAAPPADSRPMMRWWWFGPSVTREEIEAEMRRMKEGGIGGFEVASVYPLALDDPACGFHNDRYLSPEFLENRLHVAARRASSGLRMDVTIGSGWSYGGPYITPGARRGAHALRAPRDHARRHQRRASGAVRARPPGRRLRRPRLGAGSRSHDLPRSWTFPARARSRCPPGHGPARRPASTSPSHTGQIVKRAASGAEGYVLDHYNRAAIETHLREAGDKLLAAAGPGGMHSVFCDSLEVYDADWTADLLEEFRSAAATICGRCCRSPSAARGERARRRCGATYGRTLTELFEDRFLVPMREWAREEQRALPDPELRRCRRRRSPATATPTSSTARA